MDADPDQPSPLFLDGTRFLHRKDYASALRCFQAELARIGNTGFTEHRMGLLTHIGNLYAMMDEPVKAQAAYNEVLVLQREDADPRAIGLTLVNLGNLAREAGMIERAKAFYLEAKDALDLAQDTQAMAVLLSNFALLAQDEGRLDEGIQYMKEAIELHKKTGYEAGLASTWGQLGRLFELKENDPDAEICYNYATTHFGSLGDPYGEAEALRGLARIYERQNDPELVLRCLNRIVSVHRRFGIKSPEADIEWRNRLQDIQAGLV